MADRTWSRSERSEWERKNWNMGTEGLWWTMVDMALDREHGSRASRKARWMVTFASWVPGGTRTGSPMVLTEMSAMAKLDGAAQPRVPVTSAAWAPQSTMCSQVLDSTWGAAPRDPLAGMAKAKVNRLKRRGDAG